jgi:hypothetical protein
VHNLLYTSPAEYLAGASRTDGSHYCTQTVYVCYKSTFGSASNISDVRSLLTWEKAKEKVDVGSLRCGPIDVPIYHEVAEIDKHDTSGRISACADWLVVYCNAGSSYLLVTSRS